MPTRRLPWFRFWIDATSHGKVRMLDDATFRTWIELLDAAAKQPWRGRFADRKEAAAIVRRPVKHIQTLIAGNLIDETTEGLTMHDWDEWQRWRSDDESINTRSTTDQPATDSETTPDQQSMEAIEKEKEKKRENNPPQAPHGGRSKAPRTERKTPITDKDIEGLVAKHADAFGSGPAVREEINSALNHTARRKAVNERQYVDTWLRRELGYRRGRVPVAIGNGRPEPDPSPPLPPDHTGVRRMSRG